MFGNANLLDLFVRRQRRVVRSTFIAELNWLVDSVELTLFFLQITIQLIYCCTTPSFEEIIDLLENEGACVKLNVAVDARAACDAISAIDACEPQGISFKLHFISVGDRLILGTIRRIHWVDTRDMLANGLVKCGIGRTLLHNARNACPLKLAHVAFPPQ